MSALRERVKRARSFGESLNPEQQRTRRMMLDRLHSYQVRHELLMAQYNHALMFRTEPESQAVAVYMLGADLGVLTSSDRPRWIRRRRDD